MRRWLTIFLIALAWALAGAVAGFLAGSVYWALIGPTDVLGFPELGAQTGALVGFGFGALRTAKRRAAT